MNATNRPWLLICLKTHPDTKDIGLEIVHGGGSPIMALGLAELAPTIMKEIILTGEDGTAPSGPSEPPDPADPESPPKDTSSE